MIYLHVSSEKVPSPLDLIGAFHANKEDNPDAHILRKHIGDYQKQYRLGPEYQKVVSDLLNCRTAHMGGRLFGYDLNICSV